MIIFNNVVLSYPYEEYSLLKGATFCLNDGVNTIICDKQSGKTSICKLLCKQICATSGQILVDGNQIDSITNESLGILYLSSNPTFFDNRSLLYNVCYPLKVRKVDKKSRKNIANNLIAEWGQASPQTKVKKLTKAQKIDLSILRGQTVARKIVLIDDLPEEYYQQIFSRFSKATFVILTSNVQNCVGHVVVLDDGKCVFQGDCEQAKQVVDNLLWVQ